MKCSCYFFGETRREKKQFRLFFDAFSVCFDEDADDCSVECFKSEIWRKSKSKDIRRMNVSVGKVELKLSDFL